MYFFKSMVAKFLVFLGFYLPNMSQNKLVEFIFLKKKVEFDYLKKSSLEAEKMAAVN